MNDESWLAGTGPEEDESLPWVRTEIAQVLRAYGSAMYWSQCIEQGMVTLLGFFGDRQNENEGYEEALERLRRDTFGRLLRRLGKIVSLPVDFEKSLRQAHERRNWLTHMFFWERRVEFHSSSGRAQMMEELAQVEAEMRELNKLVHLVALKYLAAVGDPDPSVDERIRCLEEERELRIL